MFQYRARFSVTRFSRYSLLPTRHVLNHIYRPWRFLFAQNSSRMISSTPSISYNLYEILRRETAEKAEKLKALGSEEVYTKYDPLDGQHVRKMEEWYARGPPPLSDYTLTFGKHRGKRIDEVPDVYVVKYLIPRLNELHHVMNHHDPIVFEAVEDYMKRNPDVKSQAGRKKTKVREGGIAAPSKRKRTTPTWFPHRWNTNRRSNVEENTPKDDAESISILHDWPPAHWKIRSSSPAIQESGPKDGAQ